MTPEPQRERDTRRMLFVGPMVLCAGLAWTAIAPSEVSKVALVVGFGVSVWAAHRLGRLGPDMGR